MYKLGFSDAGPGRAARRHHEKPSVGEEVGDVLTPLIPWATSFLFHAGILLLAVFMVWTTAPESGKVHGDEPIIPVVIMSETPGAVLSQSERNSLSKGFGQSSISLSRTTKGGRGGPALNGDSGADNGVGLIGIGQRAGDDGAGAANGRGNGWGPGFGVGTGTSGGGSPFGDGIDGGKGEFKASLFGNGGNGRKIVYVVDASGSLIDSLPFVIQELRRSIMQLVEKQEFGVIFFQGDQAIEVPPAGLKKATAANKDAAIQWMEWSKGNVTPMGESNPVRALRLALQYNPDLMFLLSDDITGHGRYEVDQRRLLNAIQDANTTGTKINTLQFLYADPLVTSAHMKGTMQLIAERSGGVYKFLDRRELGIE